MALSVFSFNERAIRAYRKVGFLVEGRSRDAIFRDGRYWDELQMSILAEEWRRLPTLERNDPNRETTRARVREPAGLSGRRWGR